MKKKPDVKFIILCAVLCAVIAAAAVLIVLHVVENKKTEDETAAAPETVSEESAGDGAGEDAAAQGEPSTGVTEPVITTTAATAPAGTTAPVSTTLPASSAPAASELVTDAYRKSGTAAGDKYTWAVPKILLESADAKRINNEIWNNYYNKWIAEELDNIEKGYSVIMYELSYGWAVNGDMLSLWVNGYTNASARYFSVYNLSVSSGRELTADEVLKAKGLTRDGFLQLVKKTLGSQFWNENEMNRNVESEKEFINQQHAKTIAQSNVEACEPYLNEKGELCIHGKVYSIGGPDYHEYLLNTETIQMRDDYDQPA